MIYIYYRHDKAKQSKTKHFKSCVLILDTFFERMPLKINDFRFFVVKTAPKLHRFKNFPARFLHRLTLISEIAPVYFI